MNMMPQPTTSVTVNPNPVSIRIRIPKNYHRQPIISRLISRYSLTVNIAAALLAPKAQDDGWFDLELQGNPQQIQKGLAYLQGLDVEVFQLKLKSILASRMPQNHLNCIAQNANELVDENYSIKNSHSEEKAVVATGQTMRTSIQLCVSKKYRHSPILATLISRYGLTVIISGAILATDIQEDGWFDLELWGKLPQINSSLNYLKQLGLQIWLLDPHFLSIKGRQYLNYRLE
jgi:hypothetical protein